MDFLSGFFGKSDEQKEKEKSPEDIEKEKRYAACEEKFEQCKKIPLDIEVKEKLGGGRRKSKSNRRRKSKSSRRGRKSRRSRK